MRALKQLIKKCISSNWLSARLYYRLSYRNNISNDFVISKIQQIAHRFDHRFIKELHMDKKDIYEMKHLLGIAVDRKIRFDDSVRK